MIPRKDLAPLIERARRVAGTGKFAAVTLEADKVRATDDAGMVELEGAWDAGTLPEAVCLPLWVWDAASSAIDGRSGSEITLASQSIEVELHRQSVLHLTWGDLPLLAVTDALFSERLPQQGGPSFDCSPGLLRKAMAAQAHEERGVRIVQLAVLNGTLHVGATRFASAEIDGEESSRWIDTQRLRAGLDAICVNGRDKVTVSLPGGPFDAMRVDAPGGTFALAAFRHG